MDQEEKKKEDVKHDWLMGTWSTIRRSITSDTGPLPGQRLSGKRETVVGEQLEGISECGKT